MTTSRSELRYNSETWRTEGEENCYACGHRVWAEYDEDGTPVVYRPVEAETEVEHAGTTVDAWDGLVRP